MFVFGSFVGFTLAVVFLGGAGYGLYRLWSWYQDKNKIELPKP